MKAEREKRLDLLPALSRRGVGDDRLGRQRRAGMAPFVFSVHSFTPRMQGRERPWHVGILWDSDPRAVGRCLRCCRPRT
jgi:predicted N-formylglutamate amidohydrolase